MKAIFCPVCGTENPLDAKFCKNDGVRLSDCISSTGPHGELPVVSAFPAQQTVQQNERLDTNTSPATGSGSLAFRIVHPRKLGDWVVVLAILVIFAGGSLAAYVHFQDKSIDPAELSATLVSTLTASGFVGISAVVSNDRIATLSGEVEDETAARTALAVAGSIKGVKGVLPELIILPSVADVQTTLEQAMSDQQLADVTVSVDQQRIATLSGHVSNEAMIDLALNTAAATPGLKGLSSHIQVVPPPVEHAASLESSVVENIVPATKGGSKSRRDFATNNSSESSSFVNPADRVENVQTIIRPRNPVADRRWLRE